MMFAAGHRNGVILYMFITVFVKRSLKFHLYMVGMGISSGHYWDHRKGPRIRTSS
jgi:hypothetical protein